MKPNMKKNLAFSVIIPCLNEERFLPLLLNDLSKQSFTDFEVIVVDGNSKDKTVAEAKKFKNRMALTVLESQARGVALQRNLGAQAASGQWIIFMDADNQLPPYFLLGLKYQLETHPKTDLFTTWMKTDGYRTNEERVISNAYNLGLNAYKLLKKPTAVGALIGIKKKLAQKIHFDPALAVFEDHDLVQRLCAAGYHFSIFADPQYTYSFRRFNRDGLLRMAALFINLNITSLLGLETQHFEKNYPMLGGDTYDLERDKSVHFFQELNSLLRTVPKNQLLKIRRAVATLINNAIN